MAKIFIAYCRDEQEWLNNRLLRFLNPLLQSNSCSAWSDQDIVPGTEFRDAIAKAIKDATVALLLVSPGFLASDFIMKEELPLILAERAMGLRVLWIPVSASIYQATVLQDIQAAIDPKTFLDELTPPQQGQALMVIGEHIREALQTGRRPPIPIAGDVDTSKSVHTVSVNIDTEDFDRIRRLTERNKTSERQFLAGLLHEALSHEELQVTYRHESEIRGGDDFLRSASEARFIALTYKTLGLALTTGNLTLPQIVRIEMAVYALPILRSWHPTLRDAKAFLLHDEWIRGVTTVLTKLTSKTVAPNLQTLDLRLLNRVPTFTSSLLTTRSAEGELLRIRFTPVLEDVEPSATPTMNLVLYTGSGARTEPVFDAYARILDYMRSRSRPLNFPIMRGGHSGYIRPHLERFVERLATTTNDSRYNLKDATFTVTAEIDERLARKLNLGHAGKMPFPPNQIYRIFDELRASGKSPSFTVKFNMKEHTAIIRAGDVDTQRWINVEVSESHKVGVFAVLTSVTEQGQTAILKRKQKPEWTHDVPGGKVADADESIDDTLTRELFEELGLEIRTNAVRNVSEYKYDPGGLLTHTPVIAVYYHYKLNQAEASYLDDSLPSATDGYSLERIPVRLLIDAKRMLRPNGLRVPPAQKDGGAEAVCHAPLEVFLRINKEYGDAVAG